jgi:peptide deformylase
MAILSVRKYGDPILRRRAKPVEAVTPAIRNVIADMIDTMYDEVGLGLAAPQIGVPLRLMVVGDEESREARALINPVITEQGGEITAEEGCLSLPGVFAPVTRAEWVRLEAQDPEGRPVAISARGLRARVFQHEMDHLDGVLILDRTTREQRKEAMRALRDTLADPLGATA